MSAPVCSTVCGDTVAGGGGIGAQSAAKISSGIVANQLLPGGNVVTIVNLPLNEIQGLGPALTADGANDRIVVNQSGIYELGHAIIWGTTADPSVEGSSFFTVNGGFPELVRVAHDLGEAQSYSYSALLELQAGDVIQLGAEHNGTAPILIAARLWLTLA